MRSCWRIHLAERASRDFFEIMAWTAANFGPRQAEVYAETLTLALTALSEGPEIPEVRKRDEIGEGIRTLHVARQGRKGRHFIVFRFAENQVIEVLRLLHDSMDLPRNVP